MNTLLLEPRKALNKAFLKIKPNRSDIENFKTNLIKILDAINEGEGEEFHKNLVIDFLKKTYYDPNYFVNTKGKNDLVIHNGKDAKTNVGVIIEAKSLTNKSEMITVANLNGKALQELVLYYMRERITHKNTELKHLVVTNIYEWFVFDAQLFNKLFAEDKSFTKKFIDFEEKRSSGHKTDYFYNEIAKPFIASIVTTIEFTHFDIRKYDKPLRNEDKEDDRKLVALYKLLSPEHLLKLSFANDSNTLDKNFYSELLHIIGLTEVKQGGKKLIERHKKEDRNSGSLLENAIIQLDSLDKISRLQNPKQYGDTNEERLFTVALELTITWVNRILFLKLLEAQLITYHKGDKSYSFLNANLIADYDSLNSLFFQVLAKKPSERNDRVTADFAKVPYLNSSLFEPTDLEHDTLFVSQLEDHIPLKLLSSTVIKNATGKKETGTKDSLNYFFSFLDAYDFASEGSEDIQEDNKTLINASVLGLIFEKINGYKDGSFFTPSFITMYMCKETIRRAVVQKFNETKNWDCKDFDSLYDKIEDRKEANTIINSLKICDPAVGSGHFLVSALNEIVAIKNDLRVLQDHNGNRLKEYHFEVVNDELIVTDEDGIPFQYNPKNKESQRIQETLFNEKQTIIENCLFGVDINPNSVKICRLRLWIELLKNAYYKTDSNELETLPNIDINIKCGNSLISRFGLDANLKKALKQSKWNIESYKLAVSTYRNAESKEQKKEMERLISDIKGNFRSEIGTNDPKKLKLEKLKGELFNQTQQTGLFERSKKEQTDWNKKVTVLATDIKTLDIEIEEIRSNAIYENAFEWRFEFPDVLNDNGDFEGFDVVIGNPPYGVNFRQEEKSFIKSNYYSMEGDFDSYIYFFEKSFSLLKSNSRLAFIVPNNLLIQKFGKKIRELILKDYSIEFIIDLGLGAFEEAVVPTVIIVLVKKQNTNHLVNFLFRPDNLNQDYKQISQESFKENENLSFNIQINADERAIIQKIKNYSSQLNEICEVKIGIECTPNFISDKPITEFSKPLVRGRNFNKYSIQFENDPKYVEYKRELLHRAREERLFIEPRKILIRQTGDRIISTIDENKLYAWKSVFVLLSNENIFHLNYLLALINSKIINFFYQKLVGEAGRTFAQVKGVNLALIPIKKISISNQQPFIERVNEILLLKSENPQADTSDLEAAIDTMVYELYGLSEEEIKIVEGS
ncbi:Eco57I restriction-modification methylase [Flavobacterium gillisiae]|uniref:site-specific DNA-methyltransferase (adenine-specific) n=1 Tax=Flavobacterium gillisiae TaxID=150146 RepID=A0A1H4FCE2_9FLAO|nr:TaqI-like C-terminal specificity domain-containing protein [Flavobacterium gillisiae]SEA95003.1 Eco57I restriction-modification methylase [Flavobacterium gillisiae]